MPSHDPASNARGFNMTARQVRLARADMRRRPVGLQRPLLVLNGYRAGPWGSRRVARRLRRLTGARGDQVRAAAFPFASTFDDAARRALTAAAHAWSDGDAKTLPALDVVGISMGGLVALWAAAPPEETRLPAQLRIERLFTIGTPHRGATLADRIAPDPAARDMRPGSPFLQRLQRLTMEAGVEIIPYARLYDGMVGALHCAPPGRGVVWRAGWRPLAHLTITMDWPITLDIARRLRTEAPLAPPPSQPPRH